MGSVAVVIREPQPIHGSEAASHDASALRKTLTPGPAYPRGLSVYSCADSRWAFINSMRAPRSRAPHGLSSRETTRIPLRTPHPRKTNVCSLMQNGEPLMRTSSTLGYVMTGLSARSNQDMRATQSRSPLSVSPDAAWIIPFVIEPLAILLSRSASAWSVPEGQGGSSCATGDPPHPRSSLRPDIRASSLSYQDESQPRVTA